MGKHSIMGKPALHDEGAAGSRAGPGGFSCLLADADALTLLGPLPSQLCCSNTFQT